MSVLKETILCDFFFPFVGKEYYGFREKWSEAVCSMLKVLGRIAIKRAVSWVINHQAFKSQIKNENRWSQLLLLLLSCYHCFHAMNCSSSWERYCFSKLLNGFRRQGAGVRPLVFVSQLYPMDIWSGICCSTSLCLSVHFCKIEIIMLSPKVVKVKWVLFRIEPSACEYSVNTGSVHFCPFKILVCFLIVVKNIKLTLLTVF